MTPAEVRHHPGGPRQRPDPPAHPPAPRDDAEVPGFVAALGIPALADIHIHFMPEPMQRAVWEYFDDAEARYSMPWPITYRGDEAARVAQLRDLGVAAIPSLTYAHKPGMARWLNAWSAEFAQRVPAAVHSATVFPEQGAAEYTEEAIAGGARLFKVHLEVGGFAADDPLLTGAWSVLAESRTPVVMHAGSAPLAGKHTGPAGLRRLLALHPDLVVVVAHLGMPEYFEFAELAADYPDVHLDTTMAATDFTERFAPMPDGYVERLGQLRSKVILGSDFPSIPYDYAHQIAALARLGLGDKWLRAVLWDNGARLLGLPDPR
ncbi:MAG: amidohydrolase [Actinobacteria bacterium]|nr:MAG: amidohydrolase [Actinomycetota bacterium]